MKKSLSFHKMQKEILKMFDYYLNKYGTRSHIHESIASGSSVGSSYIDLYNTIRNENSKRPHGSTPSSELGMYSGTDFISTLNPK
jgi:hypothetical protein